MSVDPVLVIARAAIDQTPPQCRVTPEHVAAIARHSDALLALGPEIVQGFYDTLYAHEPTAAVFADGERPMREESLAHWWRRTVTEPIDDTYWSWMAMVGLIHVIRRVSNPMMLSMTHYVARFIARNTDRIEGAEEDRAELVEGFERVAAMTGAIIAYGYDQAVSAALFEIAGMPEALLTRLRDQAVREALVTARADVGA